MGCPYVGPESGGTAYAIAVDASANVYVTGFTYTSRPQNLSDYATIKYNATGQQQWVARYHGPSGFGNKAVGIAVDESGSVYVT